MEAVSAIRVDEKLGSEPEIIYSIQHLSINRITYALQVMTSTRIYEDVLQAKLSVMRFYACASD